MGESQSKRSGGAGRAPAAGPVVGIGWAGWAGFGAVAVGVLLCGLGWYGVSGEALVSRQLPYLASATAPGVALIVAGAVLLGSPGAGAGVRRAARGGPAVADDTPPAGAEPGAPVGVDGGTLYHRAGCPLVAGKAGVRVLAAADGRSACPVCLPGGPDAWPDAWPGAREGDG
ncbi:hypothetical protein ABT095_01640 [Kitasatospora sp. NPDC002227]|uniref:hypothetical protein n=1 Tax=Kitasatospora sp. NPDC002227 TaxID=3154773 RepID=UPI003333D8D4